MPRIARNKREWNPTQDSYVSINPLAQCCYYFYAPTCHFSSDKLRSILLAYSESVKDEFFQLAIKARTLHTIFLDKLKHSEQKDYTYKELIEQVNIVYSEYDDILDDLNCFSVHENIINYHISPSVRDAIDCLINEQIKNTV